MQLACSFVFLIILAVIWTNGFPLSSALLWSEMCIRLSACYKMSTAPLCYNTALSRGKLGLKGTQAGPCCLLLIRAQVRQLRLCLCWSHCSRELFFGVQTNNPPLIPDRNIRDVSAANGWNFNELISFICVEGEWCSTSVQSSISDVIVVDWLQSCSHAVTYGMTSSATYYYTKAMTDLFVNIPSGNGFSFNYISSVNDVWTVSFSRFWCE